MIDFQSIRHTTAGIECRYLGQRNSFGHVIHRFAVVNPTGEVFTYYNEQGQRVEYAGSNKWEVHGGGHQIIEQKPPKIVEVTKWVGLFTDGNGNYFINTASTKGMLDSEDYLAKQQHTFRFEVPHD